MPKAIYANADELLLHVLDAALGHFKGAFDRVRAAAVSKGQADNGVLLHDAWMLGLHKAFQDAYRDDPRKPIVYAAPLKAWPEAGQDKVPFGRGEYGFDLAVVEMATEDAPYHVTQGGKTQVAVVERHLWQVESEIANDGTKLAEDLGKLVGGAAPCKLLVTVIPRRDNGTAWRKFVERAGRRVAGCLYVAMIDSYATEAGRKKWLEHTPELRLYRKGDGSTALEPMNEAARAAMPLLTAG
jgi:hypothetical protein